MKRWMEPAAAAAILVVAGIPLYRPSGMPMLDVWLSLWLVFFVVGFVLIALEGALFMESPAIRRASHFAVGLFATGAIALIAGSLTGSWSSDFTLAEKCRTFLGERSAIDWAVRVGGVTGLFTFGYGAIGSAVWPLVRRHYEDPDNDLALRVPSGRIVIPLQAVRGFFTTLALIPLLAAVPATGVAWCLRLSLLLVATMAVAPLTMATGWPSRLRVIHMVEISVFATMYAFVVWWLMA